MLGSKGRSRALRRRVERRHVRSQRGATLIEVLVVSGVMVPVILAAALGLMLTIRLSATAKTTQELEAAAASYAESLKQVAYVPCSSDAGYDTAAGAWAPHTDTGISVGVIDVQYWDQASRGYSNGTCTQDQGAQLVEVQATRGSEDVRVSVVKRDPGAFAGATTSTPAGP